MEIFIYIFKKSRSTAGALALIKRRGNYSNHQVHTDVFVNSRVSPDNERTVVAQLLSLTTFWLSTEAIVVALHAGISVFSLRNFRQWLMNVIYSAATAFFFQIDSRTWIFRKFQNSNLAPQTKSSNGQQQLVLCLWGIWPIYHDGSVVLWQAGHL